MRSMIFLTSVLAIASCVRKINPAGHTGTDGSKKGAHTVELEAAAKRFEGEATGIVTYPGGDRIDWKKVELPADTKGDLELELSWRAPRPGLDLAFDVYYDWGDKLGETKTRAWNAAPPRRAARNANGNKSLTLKGVKGEVFVRVFATNRGDAGRYKLTATFAPEVAAYDPKFDEVLQEGLKKGTIQIPDPPKLGAVYAPCGDEYDKTNPDCIDHPPPCGDVYDPKSPDCLVHPPACNRAAPDKKNPSCKNLCDENKLDPKNPDCRQFYQECTPATWVDPSKNPKCDVVPKPTAPSIDAKIVNPEIQNGKVIITIAVGKDSPVAKDWTGSLLDSSSNAKPKARLKKGAFLIFKVKAGLAYGRMTDTSVSLDEVNRNTEVVIDPPADYVPDDDK